MSADSSDRPLRDRLGVAALMALPVLCCAGPALLAAGALGALGSWLTNPWLIGAAVLLALGVTGRLFRRRPTAGEVTGGACPRPPVPTAPPAVTGTGRRHGQEL